MSTSSPVTRTAIAVASPTRRPSTHTSTGLSKSARADAARTCVMSRVRHVRAGAQAPSCLEPVSEVERDVEDVEQPVTRVRAGRHIPATEPLRVHRDHARDRATMNGGRRRGRRTTCGWPSTSTSAMSTGSVTASVGVQTAFVAVPPTVRQRSPARRPIGGTASPRDRAEADDRSGLGIGADDDPIGGKRLRLPQAPARARRSFRRRRRPRTRRPHRGTAVAAASARQPTSVDRARRRPGARGR